MHEKNVACQFKSVEWQSNNGQQ